MFRFNRYSPARGTGIPEGYLDGGQGTGRGRGRQVDKPPGPTTVKPLPGRWQSYDCLVLSFSVGVLGGVTWALHAPVVFPRAPGIETYFFRVRTGQQATEPEAVPARQAKTRALGIVVPPTKDPALAALCGGAPGSRRPKGLA